MDGKHVISTPKLFNSIEYDSIMKQSYFTYYEKDNESKTDISASVDVLIDAIDKAEKNSELISRQSVKEDEGILTRKLDPLLDESSKNNKLTPNPNKQSKINFALNNFKEESVNSTLNSFKLKHINKIMVDKLKSVAVLKENSKTQSHSNTKLYNESNKSEKKTINHSKVLSMPKLTINNNVINNITVINNVNNPKTLSSVNKNIINEIGNESINNSKKPNDYTNNLNILNQKYTRNMTNNIIVGSHNNQSHFLTKTTNTIDIAKEILNKNNKFLITNFTSAKVKMSSDNKLEPLNMKKINSMTSRKYLTPKVTAGQEKNFLTIDVINNQKMNNHLIDDLNRLVENKKLKFRKIENLCKDTSETKRSISTVKIPFLNEKISIQLGKYESNSIKQQIDNLPNYPLLRENNNKSMKPFSDRGIINNTMKFQKNNK